MLLNLSRWAFKENQPDYLRHVFSELAVTVRTRRVTEIKMRHFPSEKAIAQLKTQDYYMHIKIIYSLKTFN